MEDSWYMIFFFFKIFILWRNYDSKYEINYSKLIFM